MDMISVISADRVIPAYDLLTPLGLPDLKKANEIGFSTSLFASPNDQIYVMSEEGAYLIDRETFNILLGSLFDAIYYSQPLRIIYFCC